LIALKERAEGSGESIEEEKRGWEKARRSTEGAKKTELGGVKRQAANQTSSERSKQQGTKAFPNKPSFFKNTYYEKNCGLNIEEI